MLEPPLVGLADGDDDADVEAVAGGADVGGGAGLVVANCGAGRQSGRQRRLGLRQASLLWSSWLWAGDVGDAAAAAGDGDGEDSS